MTLFYSRTAVRGRLQLSSRINIRLTEFCIFVQVSFLFLRLFKNANRNSVILCTIISKVGCGTGKGM
jgi:hypothetical protein